MGSDTKQRLINTASELIWKSSYGSVSVDDICAQAGVKKGSFYHFFKSKADLGVAAIEDHYETSKPEFDAAFSPCTPALERFKNLSDLVYNKQLRTLEEYGRVCGCPFATLGSEMAGQEELICEKIEEVFGYHTRYVESALRDLVAEGMLNQNTDISAKAQEIHNYIMGQVMMARIQNSMAPLESSLKSGLFSVIGVKQHETEYV